MKKSLSLILGAALVLSACGATPPRQSTPAETTPAKKSLKDLLSLGTAQKCTYRFTTGDTDAQGELLVNGKKFRQTTKIVGGNGTMTVSAYSDGNYMYTWNDQTKNSGIKMKLDADSANPSTPETGKAAGTSVNLDEKYDYNCQPVVTSDADFALPTDVEFMDLGDLSKFQEDLKSIDVEKLKQQFGDGQ